MELPLLRRRKITFLFLLGVGIPSLALGYLAFRGIRNELAVLEQRRLDEHRAISQLINDTIDASLSRVEQSFFQILAGEDLPLDSAAMSALRSLRDEQPLADDLFLMENRERVLLPVADLLFHLNGGLPAASALAWPAAAGEQMRAGQADEFRRDRLRGALANYQRAFAAVTNPALQGEALLAIARVQRKAGEIEAALATCETLFRDYDKVGTTSGMPIAPTARLQHAALLASSGDTVIALEGYLDLYARLVRGEWSLERAQFEFFESRTKESLAELSAESQAGGAPRSYTSALDSLEVEESTKRERTERLLVFQETAAGELTARVDAKGDLITPTGNRFVLESAGHVYLVSLLGQGAADGKIWGLILDGDNLRDDLLRGTLESHVDSSTTDWNLKGRDGTSILARGSVPQGANPFVATFAGNFPPWLIEFYQRPQNPYRRLLASGQSIYLYMFLLIASILVFALVLTVRAVTQELELARLKSDFVSTVSHEFKSPLTSIRQLAEMLQAGRVPTEERRQRYYDVLVEQSSRLSSLVTNILDLARIEEGRKEFRFETVDVGELVEELTTTTQHRVGHEGFVVEAQVEERLPVLRADREAIAQAISNLVDNAIRYSGDSRRINLYANVDDGQVTIAVEDFGVGIPETEIDKVFDRFYRGGDALTRSVKGSGLGLTLVKEIVEAHGGTVAVESKPGEGSTFSIRLSVTTERNDAEDSDR